MSIFNPWGELRALKARLAAEEEAYRVEEAQQQAEWAKKNARLLELERTNAVLRRDSEELRRELKEAVSRGANNNVELERKLSEMTEQRNRANNALKRKDRVVQRREADIKELELDLREMDRKMRRAEQEAAQLKDIKVKFMNQGYELIAVKQQVDALKDKLANAILRDPQTGRLIPRKKEKAQ